MKEADGVRRTGTCALRRVIQQHRAIKQEIYPHVHTNIQDHEFQGPGPCHACDASTNTRITYQLVEEGCIIRPAILFLRLRLVLLVLLALAKYLGEAEFL